MPSATDRDADGFNPRRPRGRRRRSAAARSACNTVVSIHAARAGGDEDHSRAWSFVNAVSIHAARAGGDAFGLPRANQPPMAFQSYASRVGGDAVRRSICGSGQSVSIDASRVGGDFVTVLVRLLVRVSRSTPPAWEATPCKVWRNYAHLPGFNPRLPRGRRRICSASAMFVYPFQSTPPAWRRRRMV